PRSARSRGAGCAAAADRSRPSFTACSDSGATLSAVTATDLATDRPPVEDSLLERIDRYWRAANYLSVGQIYLLDNPLLKQPLAVEHIKPRLLGHWGTTPGLNLVYVHCNRVITERDLDAIYIAGPGHGGPGVVA